MERQIQIRFFLTLSLLFTLTIFNTEAQHRRNGRSVGNRTVYYVVCASFSSLAEAKKACDKGSQFDFNLHVGPIYQAKANGKTVYRMCEDCYYKKEDAQKFVNQWGGWIWPSRGLAKCVYLGRYENYEDTGGDYIKMTPLKPR